MEDIFTAIDWIRIAYTAANNLGNSPQMLMHLTEAETTAGAISATLPPEAMVWDITTPAQAYVCTPGTENTFALKTGANKPFKTRCLQSRSRTIHTCMRGLRTRAEPTCHACSRHAHYICAGTDRTGPGACRHSPVNAEHGNRGCFNNANI